jgi:hypothetical protein
MQKRELRCLHTAVLGEGQKKGISHIEVILAFLLFITAVGFGLYFFNASNNSGLVDTTLIYAFREIEQNTSTTIEVFSVKVNGSLILTDSLALNFSGIAGNSSVESYDGGILDSSRGGTNDEIVYVSSPNWAGEDVLFVVFSEEFQDDGVLASEHNESYYKIGSSEIRDVISERKFRILNESYYADYRALKGRDGFNLPDRADFGFTLRFDDGGVIVSEKDIPDGFEVFSETKRVEVLEEDGSRSFADLIVKVW